MSNLTNTAENDYLYGVWSTMGRQFIFDHPEDAAAFMSAPPSGIRVETCAKRRRQTQFVNGFRVGHHWQDWDPGEGP